MTHSISTTNGKLTYQIDNGIVILDMIQVDAQSRGKGIASQLMAQFIEMFKNQEIELHAYPQDELTTVDGLVSFYEKFGFQIECGSVATGYEMRKN